MKIVVAVKQVEELDDEFELLDDPPGVDPAFLERDLNEWDSFSLEAALISRERAGTGEVVVVTVGDDEAEEVLLACLAKGADRAVRVWDDSLAGADALAIAAILAAAIERESPDLVLCGVQSSDAVNGATGIATAAYLRLPHVAVVSALDCDAEARRATVHRELEGGLVEVLTVPLPVLLTVQTGIAEPRYANLRAIKQARDKPLARLGLADIGLGDEDVAAVGGSHLRSLAPPDTARAAEMIDGSPEEVATRIRAIVSERMTG